MRQIRITKLPEFNNSWNNNRNPFAVPSVEVNRTLKPTTKENATLEAEKDETAVTNLNDDGLPEFYKIGGKSHAQGGTPLNLPEDSFIFSSLSSWHICWIASVNL